MKTIIAAIGALLAASIANAAEIKVISTQATEEAYKELVAQFEKATGHKVTTFYSGTINVAKKLADGEQYDLVIMSAPAIDEHTKLGKVVAGSKVDFAKSGTGLAVKRGADKPDIGSVDAFKKTLLNAKSIGYSAARPASTWSACREARRHRRGQIQAQADAVRRIRGHLDRRRRHRDRLPADP